MFIVLCMYETARSIPFEAAVRVEREDQLLKSMISLEVELEVEAVYV